MTFTETGLLATGVWISVLTAWAVLLIGAALPTPAGSGWTCARKLTVAFPLGPIVPRFQTIVPPWSAPALLLNESAKPAKLVPAGTGSESCTLVAGSEPG